jgi:hypothetical protein
MVSMYIFANRGTGVATTGGIRTCWVWRTWQRWHVRTYQAMSLPMKGHQYHSKTRALVA